MISVKKEEMLKFQLEIDTLVEKKGCSYMEAILLFCEENDLEPERVPALLSNALQSRVEEEASDLNLIKTNGKPKMRL